MRNDSAPKGDSAGSVRVRFQVTFSRGPRGERRVAPVPQPPMPEVARERQPAMDAESVPKLTRLLVLGYHFERLVHEGKVKNYAEIARLTGLSTARITQIIDLTLLPPSLQQDILLGNACSLLHEPRIRGRSRTRSSSREAPICSSPSLAP